MQSDHIDHDGPRIAEIIREEIAKRRISRQTLADQARISISTLEKALSGKRNFTLSTLVRLEAALGLRLRQESEASTALPITETPNSTAPDELGSYSRKAVSWIEGRYRTIRPGFNRPDTVYSYITTIRWDDASNCLRFEESERQDAKFSQSGKVAMPYLSHHIYLVTNESGQFRTVVLGPPNHDKMLHGILTTLFVGDGTQLVPISVPIILQWVGDDDIPELGVLEPGNPHHAIARALIDRTVNDGFAHFNL